jgi:hypothetical protein
MGCSLIHHHPESSAWKARRMDWTAEWGEEWEDDSQQQKTTLLLFLWLYNFAEKKVFSTSASLSQSSVCVCVCSMKWNLSLIHSVPKWSLGIATLFFSTAPSRRQAGGICAVCRFELNLNQKEAKRIHALAPHCNAVNDKMWADGHGANVTAALICNAEWIFEALATRVHERAAKCEALHAPSRDVSVRLIWHQSPPHSPKSLSMPVLTGKNPKFHHKRKIDDVDRVAALPDFSATTKMLINNFTADVVIHFDARFSSMNFFSWLAASLKRAGYAMQGLQTRRSNGSHSVCNLSRDRERVKLDCHMRV